MDAALTLANKDKKALVSINGNSIIFHVLILLVLAGLATNFFTEYHLGGFNKYAIKHLVVFTTVFLTAVLWKLNFVKSNLVFMVIVYINILSSTVYLPFRMEDSLQNFESYFLRVEMIVFIMGLLLAVFEKPWHQFVVIAYNTLFIVACAMLVPELSVGRYILAFIIISSVAAISYFVFSKVILLQNDLNDQNTLVSKQNRELKELTNFRKDIMKIIAHDLKTPIHQLSILAEVARTSEAPADKDNCLVLLKQSIDKTYGMLENLLEWSMQNDEALKSYMDLNIHVLVDDIRKQYTENLTHKKISLINEVDIDLQMFYSKEVFETVIRNLLTNAIKFSPQNEAIVIKGEESEDSYSLSIHNKAPGLDASKLDRINNGQAIESSRGTDNEKGSGKGLFICKRMLEKNNATLKLKAVEEGVVATILVHKSIAINGEKVVA